MLLFWYEEKDNWKRKIVAILVFILFFTKGNVAIVKFLVFVNNIALPFYIYRRKYMLRIWVWFSLLLLQQWILSSHHSSLHQLHKMSYERKMKNFNAFGISIFVPIMKLKINSLENLIYFVLIIYRSLKKLRNNWLKHEARIEQIIHFRTCFDFYNPASLNNMNYEVFVYAWLIANWSVMMSFDSHCFFALRLHLSLPLHDQPNTQIPWEVMF